MYDLGSSYTVFAISIIFLSSLIIARAVYIDNCTKVYNVTCDSKEYKGVLANPRTHIATYNSKYISFGNNCTWEEL